MLTQDEQRNDLLLTLCLEMVGAGRQVLCLSDRVAHLQILLDGFRSRSEGNCSASLYVGGQRRDARAHAEENCQMLFGTFAMAQEGLDVPRLDTLILASPASDITQAVGRILRPSTTKMEPLVIDIEDDLCLPFIRQNEHRRRFYARAGMTINGSPRMPPDAAAPRQHQTILFPQQKELTENALTG